MEINTELPTSQLERFPREQSQEFSRSQDLDSRLEELVRQNPGLAEPLRKWREEPKRKKDRRVDRNEDLKTPLRRTVPDMQQRRDEEDRNQRAQSAPPTSDGQNSTQIPHSNAQSHSSEDHHCGLGREPVVRHIPIFVEGRDEPVLPRDVIDSPRKQSQEHSPRMASPRRQQVPDSHASSDRPLHVPVGGHQQHIPGHIPSATGGTSINIPVHYSGPPPKPQPAGGGTTIPINVDNPPKPQNNAVPKPQNNTAPKASQNAAPKPAAPPAPPKPPPTKPDPLDQVKAVQEDVSTLQKQVEEYAGSEKRDKQYIYLDEMLTRNLLKLDNIEAEGREDVRGARREAIRTIQRTISLLESKAPQPGLQEGSSASSQNQPSQEGHESVQNSSESTMQSAEQSAS